MYRIGCAKVVTVWRWNHEAKADMPEHECDWDVAIAAYTGREKAVDMLVRIARDVIAAKKIGYGLKNGDANDVIGEDQFRSNIALSDIAPVEVWKDAIYEFYIEESSEEDNDLPVDADYAELVKTESMRFLFQKEN